MCNRSTTPEGIQSSTLTAVDHSSLAYCITQPTRDQHERTLWHVDRLRIIKPVSLLVSYDVPCGAHRPLCCCSRKTGNRVIIQM